MAEVRRGEMLQLPLYAMALQRLVFPDEKYGLFDIGYWSLRKDGFKPIAFERWEEDQQALIQHVHALVDRLRRGRFVVDSRTPGCEAFCEFGGVCRIRQARAAEKSYELSLPELSIPVRRSRRKSAEPSSALRAEKSLSGGADPGTETGR
jgi:hypothetical protein